MIDVALLGIIRRWYLRGQVSLREIRQTLRHLTQHRQAIYPR